MKSERSVPAQSDHGKFLNGEEKGIIMSAVIET